MKLAASQIGWNADEQERAAALLARHGFEAVELAPGKLFAAPERAGDGEIRAVREWWRARGLEVVALQALLFGHPELVLFGSDEARAALRDHLAAIIRLGGKLGARALVFGSPRNRARGPLPEREAWQIAVPFFAALGEVARDAGTCLCIEPNPPRYGADFITTAREALQLVREVGSPGFALHLDSACTALAGEDIAERIAASGAALRHFHLSEPDLGPVGPQGKSDLPGIAAALREIGYSGAISIEMRAAPEGNLERLEVALHHLGTSAVNSARAHRV